MHSEPITDSKDFLKPASQPCALLLLLITLTLLAGHLLAECSTPDAPSTVVARWDGGRVTVGDLCAKINEGASPARMIATFPSYLAMYEQTTQQIAVKSILLKKAADLKLQQMPEWKAAEKLIEEQTLTEILQNKEWSKIKPTEDEIGNFAKDHLNELFGKDMPQDPIPDIKTQLTWHLRNQKLAQAMNALQAKAEADFSWRQPAEGDEDWSKMTDPELVVKVGKFNLSAAEARALGKLWSRPVNNSWDLAAIQNFIPERVPLAEMARAEKMAETPEFARVKQLVTEQWLTELARKALKDQWFSEFSPTDAQIKEWYDKNWQGDEPTLVTYDVLVIPYSSPGEAGRSQALASATDALKKARAGTNLEELAGLHPEYRFMAEQSRTLPPGMKSEFGSAAQGVKQGEIIPQPIEDFGGYCVVHINNIREKRKMPLDYVKGTVANWLLEDYKTKVFSDFEGVLLDKYKFSISYQVLRNMNSLKGG